MAVALEEITTRKVTAGRCACGRPLGIVNSVCECGRTVKGTFWTPDEPFAANKGFADAFFIAWGRYPYCGICGKGPLGDGDVLIWRKKSRQVNSKDPSALCDYHCFVGGAVS